MANQKLTYLHVPGQNASDNYVFNASYIDGKTPQDFSIYCSDIYRFPASEDQYEWAEGAYREGSNNSWYTASRMFAYLGPFRHTDYFIGARIEFNSAAQSMIIREEDIILNNPSITWGAEDPTSGAQIIMESGVPVLCWIPTAGTYYFGTTAEDEYWYGKFPKEGLWTINQAYDEADYEWYPLVQKIDFPDVKTYSPTTYYASTPAGGSDYSFATTFDNDYLERLTGKKYYPKHGDALIVPEMNAIYRYISFFENMQISSPLTHQVKVYVYQPIRDNINIANKEAVSELVGNFTYYGDGIVNLTENLIEKYPPSGYWNGTERWTLQNESMFKYYSADPNDNTKKTPLIFKDSAFQLVAYFSAAFTDTLSSDIKNYISNHYDEFPLLKYDTAYGGVVEGTIFVLELEGVKFGSVGYICSNLIDNSIAIEAYSKSRKTRNILFEFWNGECWFDSTKLSDYSYLVSPDFAYSLDRYQDDYTLTIYWTEEFGGEGFDLKTYHGSNSPLPTNSSSVIAYNSLDPFASLINSANWVGKNRCWVYERPISQEAFRTKVEFSADDYGSGDLVIATMDQYAKVGDIHIKTPTNISISELMFGSGTLFNKIGLAAYRCCGCYPGKNKQRWKKIF